MVASSKLSKSLYRRRRLSATDSRPGRPGVPRAEVPENPAFWIPLRTLRRSDTIFHRTGRMLWRARNPRTRHTTAAAWLRRDRVRVARGWCLRTGRLRFRTLLQVTRLTRTARFRPQRVRWQQSTHTIGEPCRRRGWKFSEKQKVEKWPGNAYGTDIIPPTFSTPLSDAGRGRPGRARRDLEGVATSVVYGSRRVGTAMQKLEALSRLYRGDRSAFPYMSVVFRRAGGAFPRSVATLPWAGLGLSNRIPGLSSCRTRGIPRAVTKRVYVLATVAPWFRPAMGSFVL